MLIDDASHPEDFAAETPCLRLLQHRGRRPGLSLDSLQLSQPHRVLMLIEGASHLEDFFSTLPLRVLMLFEGASHSEDFFSSASHLEDFFSTASHLEDFFSTASHLEDFLILCSYHNLTES